MNPQPCAAKHTALPVTGLSALHTCGHRLGRISRPIAADFAQSFASHIALARSNCAGSSLAKRSAPSTARPAAPPPLHATVGGALARGGGSGGSPQTWQCLLCVLWL